MNIADLTSTLPTGDGVTSHAGFLVGLVNSVWFAASTLATGVNLTDNFNSVNHTPDLYAALSDPAQFTELFNDFVAMTLHPIPNAGASGNDPDCRIFRDVAGGHVAIGTTMLPELQISRDVAEYDAAVVGQRIQCVKRVVIVGPCLGPPPVEGRRYN